MNERDGDEWDADRVRGEESERILLSNGGSRRERDVT